MVWLLCCKLFWGWFKYEKLFILIFLNCLLKIVLVNVKWGFISEEGIIKLMWFFVIENIVLGEKFCCICWVMFCKIVLVEFLICISWEDFVLFLSNKLIKVCVFELCFR